jgi:hypothetical protein
MRALRTFKSFVKREQILTVGYVLVSTLSNLIFNKVIFFIFGAAGFSSYALIKNYINYGLNLSTFNAQNVYIYVFTNLKQQQHLLRSKIAFISILISILYALFFYFRVSLSIEFKFLIFLLPVFALFQNLKFYSIQRKKYLNLILTSLILFLISLIFLLKFKNLKLAIILSFCFTLHFYFPDLISLIKNIDLKKNWSKYYEFLKIALKSYLPNIISGIAILKIREIYFSINKTSTGSEISGIFDMSYGLSIMIFSFILTCLNLILLPKFKSNLISLKSAYIYYVYIILIYLALLILAPIVLNIAFGQLSQDYINFFKLLLIVDLIRCFNLIPGFYIYSKGKILHISSVEAILLLLTYLIVSQFIGYSFYIFQYCLLFNSIVITFYYLYLLKIVK